MVFRSVRSTANAARFRAVSSAVRCIDGFEVVINTSFGVYKTGDLWHNIQHSTANIQNGKRQPLAKIHITLKLFATLAPYLPENADHFQIEDGRTVEDLIKALQLPADAVKLIFVNGRKQDNTYELKSGDRLGLFPPVGGG
jgi:molybdopterin converting factor small subunit